MMITGDKAKAAEQGVKAALDAWLAGTMKPDADALAPLLADGYTYTHATNAVVDPAERWLESFRSGGRYYITYQAHDLSFRVYPGAVVLTGRAHQEMDFGGRGLRELNTHFTSVWIEDNGKWKCAAWQATRLPDA